MPPLPSVVVALVTFSIFFLVMRYNAFLFFPGFLSGYLAYGAMHYAIHAMKQTGGSAEDVTDEEVVEGIRLLAECEGIFSETAGGVTVADITPRTQVDTEGDV